MFPKHPRKIIVEVVQIFKNIDEAIDFILYSGMLFMYIILLRRIKNDAGKRNDYYLEAPTTTTTSATSSSTPSMDIPDNISQTINNKPPFIHEEVFDAGNILMLIILLSNIITIKYRFR